VHCGKGQWFSFVGLKLRLADHRQTRAALLIGDYRSARANFPLNQLIHGELDDDGRRKWPAGALKEVGFGWLLRNICH